MTAEWEKRRKEIDQELSDVLLADGGKLPGGTQEDTKPKESEVHVKPTMDGAELELVPVLPEEQETAPSEGEKVEHLEVDENDIAVYNDEVSGPESKPRLSNEEVES